MKRVPREFIGPRRSSGAPPWEPVLQVLTEQWMTERGVVKDVSGCWLYQGQREKYGPFRKVYESSHGQIRRDQKIRHTCDVRGCVNPDHLVVGSHIDNMRDAVIRGGNKYGGLSRMWPRTRFGVWVLDQPDGVLSRLPHQAEVSFSTLWRAQFALVTLETAEKIVPFVGGAFTAADISRPHGRNRKAVTP